MLKTKSAPYTFVKLGTYYFSRRVPKDLSHHYKTERIIYSLRTKSSVVASSRARRAAQQLDEHWYHLRVRDVELPGKHLLRMSDAPTLKSSGLSRDTSGGSVKLSEGMSIYLRLKGKDRPVTFHRAAERACGYVIDACGDKELPAYTRADANSFRDALIAKGLAGSSITRVFGTVRSIFNLAAAEIGLSIPNPFSGVYYDRQAGVQQRKPLPIQTIQSLQKRCRDEDDDLRWIVALVSDTGMRLAEAAGLLLDDIRIDTPIPHLIIQEHPWRRLKTGGSARAVPLVGASMWAAERILAEAEGSKFAFPRYNKDGATNANAASAALNKWMKDHVERGCTMHSFRHSMRDRLRAVECPSDVVDQIGGWHTDGVGSSYGSGYPLEVLAKWVHSAVAHVGCRNNSTEI